MDKAKIKPVGIWIRVSTEDQVKGESPEHHEKRARFYAESKGWQVKEVYRLEAISGKSVINLPETKKMLGHIKLGHITGLIFSKLARLARNTKELLEFSEIFREYNADLISLQESIDTSTPAGRLFYTMIAAMAQWEREEIADRVAASVPIRAKLGKSLGGQASFGYRWQDKKLAVDSKEAPIRKLIYELFLEHRRKKTVARILNEKGYRTRNGSKFSDTTIERLLKDPIAKGMHRLNYTKSLGENKKWIMKPQKEWIFMPVEPIVSEELWNKCNLILEEQEKKNKRPSRKAVHLFTGIAYCECGSKLYVPSNSPKYTCYKCRNKIGVNDLEEIFHNQLQTFFFSPKEMINYLNQADKTIKDKEELLRALDEERNKIQKEMNKVYRLYIEDQITPEGFGKQYKPLEERLKQTEDQIPELQGEIDFLKIQYLSSDQIIGEAKNFYSRWPELIAEEKRKIIENITENIVIGKESVVINLCYLPSSSEMVAEKQRNFIPVLPFCKLTLNALKPLPFYPPKLQTIGDHLRKKRLDLNLFQKDIAKIIGSDETSVNNWETNKTTPCIAFLPRIIRFLGYIPYDSTRKASEGAIRGLGEKKIRASREYLGLSQAKLAKCLKIDPTTLSRWEEGKSKPSKTLFEKLDRFFNSCPLTGGEPEE